MADPPSTHYKTDPWKGARLFRPSFAREVEPFVGEECGHHKCHCARPQRHRHSLHDDRQRHDDLVTINGLSLCPEAHRVSASACSANEKIAPGLRVMRSRDALVGLNGVDRPSLELELL